MSLKRPYTKTIFIFGLCFLTLFFNACSQVPEKKPIETTQPEIQVPAPEKELPAEPETPIYRILAQEADKLVHEGEYQHALFIYNQAYAEADDLQKQELIPLIEKLLARTPGEDIENFSMRPDISIPDDLLLYWMGWSFALEDDSVKAREKLQSFLHLYPEHPNSVQAADLLEIVIKTGFNRETIGCLLPLTGKYAVFGHQALAGIQLAIQELSKKYNREFKIIIEDSKADPHNTAQGVNRLYQENVSAIIGPLLKVNEAGDRAEKLGIPLIALTQKEEFPEQGEYLFSNFITPRMQVRTLGAYLFGELGIKRVAILYPQEKYGQTYMNLFWDTVEEYGAEVTGVESYDGKGTDFTTALQKLTGEYYPIPEFLKPEPEPEELPLQFDEFGNLIEPEPEPESVITRKKEDKEPIVLDFEALFIPDSPSTIKLILPQLAFNDIRGVYLAGTNLWHHKSLLEKDIRTYSKNTIISDGFFERSDNPATREFSIRFKELFERTPKFLEAIGYDTASILLSTSMDDTINSHEDLKTALQGGRVYEGATGITVFDNSGNAHRRLFLVTIKKNKFIEINH